MSAPDDVTRGPEAASARAPGGRAFALAVVGMALAVWWPAFTLGAWGQLFFDQMLAVWAVSVAGIVIVLVQSRGRARIWRVLTLSIPTLWLVLGFVDHGAELDVFGVLADLLGTLVGIVGIPFTLWTLLRVLWPELFSELRLRQRIGVFVTVAAIAVASFGIGVFNDRFLTCADFALSGNSDPPACAPATPTPTSATPTPTSATPTPTSAAPTPTSAAPTLTPAAAPAR